MADAGAIVWAVARNLIRTPAHVGPAIALASVVFTLAVWAWMLTRPAGTFHDQGGLAITVIYLPSTFGFWFLCVLLSSLFRPRTCEGDSDLESVRVRELRSWWLGLTALGFFLSIGTLFIA